MGIDINKIISVESITQINIGIDVATVEICTTKYSEIHVNGILSNGSSGIFINASGSTLNIEEDVSIIRMATVGLFQDSHISIGIPEEYFGDVNIKCGVGTSIIRDLEGSKLTIKGGTGSIKVNDVKFNNMTISVGVGDAKVNLSKECGDIKFKGGVGRLSLEMDQVGGNLKYSGGVGGANIRIPKNTPVAIKTSTGIGRCKVKAVTSNENKYTFDINVGIGDVKIYN